jgi:hypothetical protein
MYAAFGTTAGGEFYTTLQKMKKGEPTWDE